MRREGQPSKKNSVFATGFFFGQPARLPCCRRAATILLAAALGAAWQTARADPPHAHSPAEFERMAAELKGELAGRPNDVDNWTRLGRTSAALHHWQDAKDAFARAIALRPDAPALHAQLGEVLTLEADGTVTPQATAEFGRAPEDPRSIFYLAIATAQQGDTPAAIKRLQALAADAPQGADWRQFVLDELDALGAGASPPSIAGQVAQELARPRPVHGEGAENPSVGALEARVRQGAATPQAWLDLSRAYRAAGDPLHALDALRRANQSIQDNVDLLLAYADALAEGIDGDKLPAPFIGAMQQINAIDPNQPDALWYLGLDAATHGDKYRAARLWQRLEVQLPADSQDRKSLQERLDALQ